MEPIYVGKYKDDPNYWCSYLGRARIKEIIFQHTETNLTLLDILFEITDEDGHPAEFLIRLETPITEIDAFLNKLREAIDHPKPHPYHPDLFYEAISRKQRI
ncbi:MAG: hypothetical protein FJ135_07140 [Deltaproteobacteria bacterium]|nr:hypothetical protein [Deltaproteobacteria bacterium]